MKCELWSINQNLATGPQLISLSFIIFSCDEQLYKRHVVSVRLSVRHISHAYNFASIHPIFLKLTWNIPPTRPFLTFSFEVVWSKVTSVGGHFVFWAKKKFVSRRYLVFNSTDWDEIHRKHAPWHEEDTYRFRGLKVKWRSNDAIFLSFSSENVRVQTVSRVQLKGLRWNSQGTCNLGRGRHL